MELKFTKMEGIGNDYVYIDATKENIQLSSEQIQKISDRHFGVGSDGVIFIRNSNKADFMMDMYNSDGSWSEMCGNGIRCVGKYIYDHNLKKELSLNIETGKGVLELQLELEDSKVSLVSVDMGEPFLKPSQVPVKWENDDLIKEASIQINEKFLKFTAVGMGNPHAVIFVDDADTFPVHEIGKLIEHHVLFPKRTNIEFVSTKGKDHFYQRTWERGAGETLACGTGACAVAVAAILTDRSAKQVQIDLRGGTLYINWLENNHIIMKGPAKEVFQGIIEI